MARLLGYYSTASLLLQNQRPRQFEIVDKIYQDELEEIEYKV